MEQKLRITSRVFIPFGEIQFRFSRSGGAGGQHVNKVSTRVELLFDMRNSQGLNGAQKRLVMERLQSRISSDGWLTLSSQESRSQWRNREIVIHKFASLLKEALKEPAPRIASKATKSSRERRLKQKKLESVKKHTRRKPDVE